MSQIVPLIFHWDGESMVPINPKRADQQYVVGEHYRLMPWEDRSEASHRRFFAAINEAWQNLPDHLAERFPTADHLRRYALIKTGFRDERSITCSSKAEAVRLAAFVKPIDDYAVVVAHESTVIVYTAQSQSYRAMGKARFQESQEKVLDEIARMIGTDKPTLEQNAEQAA